MTLVAKCRAVTGVVILNYNGWRYTIDCILSLLELEEQIRIIVIDNQSSDGSEHEITSWMRTDLELLNAERTRHGRPKARFQKSQFGKATTDIDDGTLKINLIQAGRNGGYAAGNNIGIQFALDHDCDFIWLLNNDTIVEREALKWLIVRVKENLQIGLCGSKLVYYDRPDVVQALGGARFRAWRGWSETLGLGSSRDQEINSVDIEAQLSFVNGASTLVTRAFIEKIGLMSEEYFLYWEEIDWAFRARGLFKLGFAPLSVVRHRVGASIGTSDFGVQSLLADFYMLRNQIRFAVKFSWRSLPVTYYRACRGILRSIINGDRPRARVLLRAILCKSFQS